MTAIILLNWNGADLTIACLESLRKAEGDKMVVVVDNASQDNSMERLTQWKEDYQDFPLVLQQETENLGFACGCNVGIQIARKFNPDYYLLLNNDTEVRPDFLTRLHDYSVSHPEYDVLTCCIKYYSNPRLVWLCGGKLTFGSRKRYFHNMTDSSLPAIDAFPITFVSGCALLAKAELLDDEGNLLSDRFFFGEEDYEFSFRMKKERRKMACVIGSVIYHKVSASAEKMDDRRHIGRAYSFYVGKLLAYRLHHSAVEFLLLKVLIGTKCALYFWKTTKNFHEAVRIACSVLQEATIKEAITRKDFLRMLSM